MRINKYIFHFVIQIRESMIKTIVFVLLLIASSAFFVKNILRLTSYLKVGRKERRSENVPARIKKVLLIAFGQKKLLREHLAGTMHFIIFWGFIILLTAIIEASLQGFSEGLSLAFLGFFYPPIAFLQDCLGFLVIVSVLVALYRRNIAHIKRLKVPAHSKFDANLILLLIFFIMTTMFLQNGLHIALIRSVGGKDIADSSVRFLSSAVASLFVPLSKTSLNFLYQTFWWLHILLVLGFLNYLPYSKHLHIATSFFNVYFASQRPRGALSQVDLENENVSKFGAADIEDLSWKQLLDGFTCTECGRCDAVCPANITGKPLSPRKIMTDIRHRTMEHAPGVVAHEKKDGKQLVGDFISEDELWACTTCGACMEECPVMIEHVDSIIDMRRYLVLNESRFPVELSTAYRNLENNYTIWSFNKTDRAMWTEDENVPIAADINDDFEILYWVGCAGSFDFRYQKVAVAFARLMSAAGVRFAILGNEEKCTGDPARRSGNEYLSQMLIKENVETLNRHNVKKIVATCPHCFNTLKNEYPDFGGNYEVIHHSQFIQDLIKSNRLNPAFSQKYSVTYHDSCYIGRYNSIYDAPRYALSSSGYVALLEMERSKDKGFCCGAGGARMFLEEKTGKRINVERVEEALRTSPDCIATACPFCMTMINDGVKAKGAEQKVVVKDIAELVLESIMTDEGI
jgi:Fe-S oxidoreductase